MKDSLKNIALVFLAGLAAFLLRGGCSGNEVNVPSPIRVETQIHIDTVIVHDTTTVEKIVSRFVEIPQPMSAPIDTPVWIFYTTDLDPDREMVIHEGDLQDSSGYGYHYQVGMSGDSLSFITISSNIPTTDKADFDPSFLQPTYSPNEKGDMPRELFRIGTKVGWSRPTGLYYGVHGAWKGIYGAANYSGGQKAFMFEVGALVPIRK